MIRNLILGAAVALIFYYDGRYRRIPNKITFSLIIFGFIFNTITLGLSGLTASLLGLIIGAALLLVPYLKGGVGAGDVKFLAAVGAILGYQFVTAAFLYGAVLGGIWSVVVLIRRGSLWISVKSILYNILIKLRGGTSKSVPLKTMSAGKEWGFPYGIVMGLGVFAVWILGIPF